MCVTLFVIGNTQKDGIFPIWKLDKGGLKADW